MHEIEMITVVLILLFTIPLATYIAFFRARLFYTGYILLSTRFLGFLPMYIADYTRAALFCLDSMMLFVFLVLFTRGWRFANRLLNYFALCIFLMIVHGVFYPYFLGFSSITSALIDGKEMLGYAALPYLLINNEEINYNYLKKLFTFISLCLTTMLIFWHVFNFSPPSYNFNISTNDLHIKHNTYLALAGCLLLINLKRKYNFNDLLCFIYICIGLLLQGHRSVVVCMFLTIGLSISNFRNVSKKQLGVISIIFLILHTSLFAKEVG